jgi:hypothetical protein
VKTLEHCCKLDDEQFSVLCDLGKKDEHRAAHFNLFFNKILLHIFFFHFFFFFIFNFQSFFLLFCTFALFSFPPLFSRNFQFSLRAFLALGTQPARHRYRPGTGTVSFIFIYF